MLLRLIKNELIKVFSKKKTWALFVFFIIGLIAVNSFIYIESEASRKYSMPEYRLEEVNKNISIMEEETNKLNLDMKKAKEDNASEIDIQDLKNNIDLNLEQLKAMNYEKKEIEKEIEEKLAEPSKTWQEFVMKRIEINKEIIEEIKAKGYQNIDNERVEIYQRAIDRDQYYLDNNIEPIDEFGFSIGENNSMIFTLLGMGILAVWIAVFMSDIVSGECNPATFKFLLVQPVSRKMILLSKIITINIVVLSMCLGSVIIVNVIGVGIIDGFDSLKSLIYVGERFKIYRDATGIKTQVIVGSGYYITYGIFLIRGLIYQSIFVMSVVSFVFMISTLFKSNIMAMTISVIVTSIGGIIPKMDVIRSGLQYSFLSYGDISDLITGEIANNLYFEGATPKFGVIVMVTTIFICYLISFLRFRNRDILV